METLYISPCPLKLGPCLVLPFYLDRELPPVQSYHQLSGLHHVNTQSPQMLHPRLPSAASYTGYSLRVYLLLYWQDLPLVIMDLDIMTIPPTSPVPPVGQANSVHT